MHRRGATLLELTIAMGLGMMLLASAYALLSPGLRTWAHTNTRAHLRQQVTTSLTRVVHDLSLTCIDSVVIEHQRNGKEGCDAVGFLSPYDDQGNIRTLDDGTPDWQRYEVLYLDADRREVRVGYRPLVRDEDEAIVYRQPGIVADFANDHTIARNVEALLFDADLEPTDDRFELVTPETPTRQNPVRVTVHAHHLEEDCRLNTAVSSLLPGRQRTEVPSL